MEIEIRAKINNLSAFQERLQKLDGITIKKQAERQTDTYIKHSQDKNRVIVFRIRRKEKNAILTLKTKSLISEKDIAWKEINIPISEPDKLEDILMTSGYEYVVLVDKVRDSFCYLDYEINIDNIRDLGYFVEIEYIADKEENIDKKILKMKSILYQLGCVKEDIIEKGYVPLLEEMTPYRA